MHTALLPARQAISCFGNEIMFREICENASWKEMREMQNIRLRKIQKRKQIRRDAEMNKTDKETCGMIGRMKKTEDRLRSFWTVKRISILLSVLYFASLIPMLVIAQYNYAGADDYSIGQTCHTAWITSHNVFAVIWQAALMAAHDFLYWMGYFSAIFMMSIHPGVFGEHVYAATTWIMVGMLTFSTIYLLRALLVKALGMSRDLCRCVTMILLLITVQCTVGRNEAFYWYCGAVNYIFFYAVGLFYLGCLLSAVYDQKRGKKIYDLCMACFLGVFVGGGNYMTALTVAIVLVLAVFLLWKNGALGRQKVLLVPIACFFVGFLASCLAPGNSYRSEITQGMGAVKAILISLYYFFDYCVSDWTTWAVAAGFLLMVPFIWKMVGDTEFTFPYPLLVFLLGYGLTSANVTPPLYAIGNIGAGRLQAIFFIQYILLMGLCLIYGLGWLQKYLEGKGLGKRRIAETEENSAVEKKDTETGKQSDAKVMCFSAPAFRGIVLLSLFIVFASALCIHVDPYYYTSSSAMTDLLNGSARAYGEAYEARTKILLDDTVKDVVFEKLPAEPQLLFFSDLTEDKDSWENKAVAKYYGKDSVVVKK